MSRGDPLAHDRNWGCESDTTSRLAFICGGDAKDTEESNCKEDGDCWNHHNKVTTVVFSADCIRSFPESNTYIYMVSRLWLLASPVGLVI